MSRNRVTGDAASTLMLAVGPAFVLNWIATTCDVITTNPAQAAGVPSATIKLDPAPQDGDEVVFTDAFGVLAAGTTVVVNGNGKNIADAGAAAATQSYNTAGISKRFAFSAQANAWIVAGN